MVRLSVVIAFSCLVHAEHYDLKATPKTVVWGNYAASNPPVLRIKPGDTVRVETVSTGTPWRFEATGGPATDLPQNMRDIFAHMHQQDRGPGRHGLTRPR